MTNGKSSPLYPEQSCEQKNLASLHKCPAKTVDCNNRHKMEHIERVCGSKMENQNKKNEKSRGNNR